MLYYDLFAGVGGFRLGMDKAGHKCVGACELDKYARQIYERRFREFISWDARELSVQQLPNFDILCAGFPCQSFSHAGKRLGFGDTRGTLFFEIMRIAKEKRPSYLFLENVRGLLFHNKGATFRTMLAKMDELGYNVEWQVINSKYFVPQNRERVFIIAHLRGQRTQQIFPLGEIDKGVNDAQRKAQGKGSWVREPYCTGLTANYHKGMGHGTLLKVGNIDTKGHNSIWGRVYDTKGIASTLNAEGGGLGAKTGLYMLAHTKANMQERYQERHSTWTLDTNGNKIGVGVKDKIRRLTPLECERLQGFPDNWTIDQSDTQRYRQMGNAVTVPVIEYIAKHIGG